MFGQENNIAVGICGSTFTQYQAWLLINIGVQEIIVGLDKQYQELNDDEHKKLVRNLKGIHNKYGQFVTISIYLIRKIYYLIKQVLLMRGKKNFCNYMKIGLIFIKSGIKNSTLYFLKNLWYNYYEILKLKGDALMKVTLLNKPDPKLPARVQVLLNRGIQPKDIKPYLETTDDIINSPLMLGADTIAQGGQMLLHSIAAEEDVLVIVDADCDGFTSSALLINYLYDLFPAFVHNHLKWFIHSEKQHGLNDCIDIAKKYKLVICPDSSSNDYEYHQQLHDIGINVLVLDHHEADHISEHACIINNQMSDYPNKELSGVGITWQFCRYLDMVSHNSYADNYLDLVALGNVADMMSLRSMETKHLIFKGFKEENIKNPFIYEMAQKNSFSLGKSDYKPSKEFGLQFSPMGAAFFIAPFVNAMVRSGTLEEKQLLFDSMLKFKAFEMIPSTKRGHKPDEEERLVDQAIRTCTNVKNRQTRAQDAGVEHLEHLIVENNMLEHKVLLFLLEPGEIDKNIAG